MDWEALALNFRSPGTGRSSTTPPSPRCRRRAAAPCTSGPTTWPRTASSPIAAGGSPRRGSAPPGRPAAQRRPARRRLRQEHQRGHRHRRRGLPLAAGDNVVIAAEEYPANRLPVDEPGRPRRRGARRCPAATAASRSTTSRAAIDGRTRVCQPQLRRVRQRLPQRPRRPRAALPASAASTSSSTRSRAWACCRSTCSGRRSTSSPPTGTSGCSGPEGRGHLLRPPRAGRPAAPGRRRLEQRGRAARLLARSTSASSRTPAAGRAARLNVAGITALGASLELLLEIGIDAVAGARAGADRLPVRAGRAGAGWRSSAAGGRRTRSGIVSLVAAGGGRRGSWCAAAARRASSSTSAPAGSASARIAITP